MCPSLSRTGVHLDYLLAGECSAPPFQMQFTDVSLDLIQRRGWVHPTPIQAQSIPSIMTGRDVIGIAKTGSGKTISYLLPLLRHVKDQRPVTGSEGPIAMVMAPTRELANQIFSEIKAFVKLLNVRVS